MNKRCAYCESDKEPYFSRVEPMGFYCVECGHNFDEVDSEDFKEIKKQLAAERDLADRLAEAIQNYLVLDENIDATTDELNGSWEQLQSSITAWKEARSE